MNFDPSILAIVAGFAVLANRLVAALVTPIFDHYKWDKFALMYIAWVVGGLLIWLSGANLFGGLIESVLIGQVLTAVIAGGGANILHDMTDKPMIDVQLYDNKPQG